MSSRVSSPRYHSRPLNFNQYIYKFLWTVPVVFLVTTIVYLHNYPLPVNTSNNRTSTISFQTSMSEISAMIRKEMQGYISSMHVTSSSASASDPSDLGTPQGQNQGEGESQSRSSSFNNGRHDDKVYPFVHVLPESQILRIVVTGGSGFVGSHLVDRLLGQGHQVTVLDNFFTGRARNLEQWTGHPHFTLVAHDITEPIKLEADQIYHLACPASPPHYQYNPVKTIKTNTQGTLNMLGMAKRVGARMLLASTSEVYGDPEVHPQVESYWGNVNPIGPRACYDEGKRVAETMMYAYHGQSNVEVRVARIFNTFGPRMHPNDGRVVSNFIIQALQGKDLTIYGEGQQTRSFQYVEDLVSGLIRLMNGNYSYPVNLGNPQEYTVKEFASLIIELTESNSTVRHMPATEDDPKQRKPDITLAKREIGWTPVVSVRVGLERTIAYFRNELARNGNEISATGPLGTRPQPVATFPLPF